MLENTPIQLNHFQEWIVQSFNALGLQAVAEVDPLGLEFNSEGRTLRVLPHTDTTIAVIEAEVLSLQDSDELTLARIATLMLRLNDEARFEHQWQVVLDADDRLCVTTSVAIADTNAELLGDLFQEGLDRATALSNGLSGVHGAVQDGSQAPPVAANTSVPVRG